MTATLEFLAASVDAPELDEFWDAGADPDLWLYRKRTTAILRKFFRMSVEVGRVPSILGSEFFRTQVTSYSVSSFEDVVIFVHDVERCLAKLDRLSQGLIGRVVMQGFSYEEAGRTLGYTRRHVDRLLPEAIDRLSEIFLAAGILERVSEPEVEAEKSCQEGEESEKIVIV
jgi:DNA-directed RNA polymerase specialized sigma24 family protein